MSTAEKAIRRDVARRAGQPFISVDGSDAEPYSIARALLGEGGFEAEVSEELRRTQPSTPGFRDHGGVMVPPHIFTATLEAGAANAGAELVFTVPGAFGRTLRPRPVAAALGCRFVPGANSLRLVRATAGHTVRWQPTETLDAPDAENTQDMAFAAESPTPSIGMVDTSFSRHLNAQASPQLAQIVDDDFRAAVATIVDTALVTGSGANGQPEGLMVRGLPSIPLGGVAPVWGDLVEAEAMLSDVFADQQLAWLTSGRGRAALRSCPILADAAAGPAWSRGQVLDWPAFASNVVPDLSAAPTPAPSGTIILGGWRNVVIGLHSIEVLIDQYAALKQGMVEASVFAVVSIGLIHPAFVLLEDGLFPQAS